MPGFSDLGTYVLIAAAIVVLAWYVLGIERNIRRGNDSLRWIRGGLSLVGEKTTLRWLGSSVVELKIAKAKEPFRTAELLVVLEPRDVPLIWLFNRSRGRRDSLIFRAQLRAAPSFDLETVSPNAWVLQEPVRDARVKYTAVQGGVAENMRADYTGGISLSTINMLIENAAHQGLTLTRLSVHRAVPNLELHYLLPKEHFQGAPRFFSSLRALSEMILNT